MATLADNNAYIEIDGEDISPLFTGEISRDVSVNQIDITAGAGVDWTQNAPGLKSYSLTLRLVYDTALYQSKVQPKLQAAVNTGDVLFKYGPEGNTAGKPKDELNVNVESVSGPNITIEKDKVMVEVSLVNGATAPTAIMELGGTF